MMAFYQSSNTQKISSRLLRILADLTWVLLIFWCVCFVLETLLPGAVSYSFQFDIILIAAIGSMCAYLLMLKFAPQLENEIEIQENKLGALSHITLFCFSLAGGVLIQTLSIAWPFPRLAVVVVSTFLFWGILFLYSRKKPSLIFAGYQFVFQKWLILSLSFLGFFVLLGCLYIYVSPSGVYTIEITPEKQNPHVVFETAESLYVPNNNRSYYLVTKTPLKFSVETPRPFHDVKVEVLYGEQNNNSSLKLGTLSINNTYHTTLMSIASPLLDELEPYWHLIQEGDLRLWVKNKEEEAQYNEVLAERRALLDSINLAEQNDLAGAIKQYERGLISEQSFEDKKIQITSEYKSRREEIEGRSITIETSDELYRSMKINETLNQLTDFHKVLSFNVSLDQYFKIPSEEIRFSNQNSLPPTIRGTHTVLFYQSEKSTFNATMELFDLNLHEGADSIKMTITQGGQTIRSVSFPDDGDDSSDGQAQELGEKQFTQDSLEPGLYRLLIETTEDIFISNLSLNSSLEALENHVYIADSEVYKIPGKQASSNSMSLYTSGESVTASTAHDASLQLLTVGDGTLAISETHTDVMKNQLVDVTSLRISKRDIKIEANGLFSMTPENKLLEYRGLTQPLKTRSQLDGMDYIFAFYPQSRQDGEWRKANGAAQVPQLWFVKNKAHFYLDFGSLSASNSATLHKVTITFYKDPVTLAKIVDKIKKIFTR